MNLKDFITLLMSGISLIFSSIVFFKDFISSRMNLGIKAEYFTPDIEQQILFVKMNFLNHSSKPITIEYIELFDIHMKKFPDKLDKSSNEYIVEPGLTIPFSKNVTFNNGENKITYPEKSATIPVTVLPYTNSAYFLGFSLNGFDSVIAASRSENLTMYIETSEGDFYYDVDTRGIYETRNNLFVKVGYSFFKKNNCITEKHL